MRPIGKPRHLAIHLKQTVSQRLLCCLTRQSTTTHHHHVRNAIKTHAYYIHVVWPKPAASTTTSEWESCAVSADWVMWRGLYFNWICAPIFPNAHNFEHTNNNNSSLLSCIQCQLVLQTKKKNATQYYEQWKIVARVVDFDRSGGFFFVTPITHFIIVDILVDCKL